MSDDKVKVLMPRAYPLGKRVGRARGSSLGGQYRYIDKAEFYTDRGVDIVKRPLGRSVSVMTIPTAPHVASIGPQQGQHSKSATHQIPNLGEMASTSPSRVNIDFCTASEHAQQHTFRKLSLSRIVLLKPP